MIGQCVRRRGLLDRSIETLVVFAHCIFNFHWEKHWIEELSLLVLVQTETGLSPKALKPHFVGANLKSFHRLPSDEYLEHPEPGGASHTAERR